MTIDDNDFEDMGDAVETAAARIQQDLEDVITEHPFRSLAASFIIGIVVAKILL